MFITETIDKASWKQKRRPASMHLVQSSRIARRIANGLLVGLIVAVIGMLLLPWQQTSRGTGKVVAYVPQERQQTIEAPVKGVVARIGEGLVEGSKVKKGEFILEIQPLAANMISQLNGQLADLEQKRGAAIVKAEAYGEQVVGYAEARDFAVQAAREMIESSQDKLASKKSLVLGYESKELQARLNLERQKGLAEKGLKPQREIEILQKEWEVAVAELNAVRKDVASIENEVDAKRQELKEKQRLGETKVDYARAMQQDALGNAATIRKEIRDIEIKLEELSRLTIVAPRDGTIFRMPVYERGQTIKEGEPILTIVPDTDQKAVELMIHGNDMPLVQAGQEVRLQFEGWPAVQFAGWPSVAVGTFGGIVSNIDPTDSGGKFRIIVVPKSETEAWPGDRYLRQGVRANGWVMLNRVSLGYEIWRQLNGFPVILSEEEPKSRSEKVPKLPK